MEKLFLRLFVVLFLANTWDVRRPWGFEFGFISKKPPIQNHIRYKRLTPESKSRFLWDSLYYELLWLTINRWWCDHECINSQEETWKNRKKNIALIWPLILSIIPFHVLFKDKCVYLPSGDHNTLNLCTWSPCCNVSEKTILGFL